MENFIFCTVDLLYFQMRSVWQQGCQCLALVLRIFSINWTLLNSTKSTKNIMLNHIFQKVFRCLRIWKFLLFSHYHLIKIWPFDSSELLFFPVSLFNSVYISPRAFPFRTLILSVLGMTGVLVDLLKLENDSFSFNSAGLSVDAPPVLKLSEQSHSFKYNCSVSSSSIFRTRNPVISWSLQFPKKLFLMKAGNPPLLSYITNSGTRITPKTYNRNTNTKQKEQ